MNAIKIDKFQTKYIYMLEKLISLNIYIPEIQREIDEDRVDNIVLYQLSHYKKCDDFCFLGDLTVVNIDDNLFIVDGMHRFAAMKRLYLYKPDYKVCVNIIKTNSLLTIEDIFCLLNKSEPVPEYIIKTTNDITKRHIIDDFLKRFKKEYKYYVSKSNYPRCPNINIYNTFINLVDSKASKKYQTGKELFDYFEWVNIVKLINIDSENYDLYNKIETKPLFIYNDIGGKWMDNDIWIEEYELVHMYMDDNIDILDAKKKRKSIPKNIRFAVWKKINVNCIEGICVCCENNVNINNYECGHIVSFYNGGSDSLLNLLPICSECNKSMSIQNMNEFCKEYGMPGQSYFLNTEFKNENIEDEINVQPFKIAAL